MGDAATTRWSATRRAITRTSIRAAPGYPRTPRIDEPIDNTDVVVWYTFGAHHIVRPEDWPVMPVSYIGFSLKPVGFFDRNPALDVAPPMLHGGNGHAAHNGHAEGCQLAP